MKRIMLLGGLLVAGCLETGSSTGTIGLGEGQDAPPNPADGTAPGPIDACADLRAQIDACWVQAEPACAAAKEAEIACYAAVEAGCVGPMQALEACAATGGACEAEVAAAEACRSAALACPSAQPCGEACFALDQRFAAECAPPAPLEPDFCSPLHLALAECQRAAFEGCGGFYGKEGPGHEGEVPPGEDGRPTGAGDPGTMGEPDPSGAPGEEPSSDPSGGTGPDGAPDPRDPSAGDPGCEAPPPPDPACEGTDPNAPLPPHCGKGEPPVGPDPFGRCAIIEAAIAELCWGPPLCGGTVAQPPPGR